MKRPATLPHAAFGALLFLFLVQWALLFSFAGPTWDAVSYYVYARSLLFDRDLDFANDFRLAYPTASPDFVAKAYDAIETPTGRAVNLFAMGSGLLWLPWLAALRLLAPLSGAAPPLSGYERFFISNVATLSALSGLAAFWLAYRVARRTTQPGPALPAAATLLFATPLLYYQYREPLYSHTAAAFTTTLVVAAWRGQSDRPGAPWQALGLGTLLGLAALTRWQNGLYLALPVVSAVVSWVRLPRMQRRAAAWSWGMYLLLVSAAAAAVFTLQLSAWKVLYGSFVTIPQGQGFLTWRPAYLGPTLFSTFRGLLPWMPVALPALLGLGVLARRRPHLGLPLLIVLLLAIYVNASTPDWFAGGGYGPRRFTSELTLWVVGYAAFLNWLPRRLRAPVVTLLGVGLALHQWLLLRYGLELRLGGRVRSMAPTFAWEDTSWTRFAQDLAGLLPRAARDPLDFLIFPGAPLDLLLRQGQWPGRHVAALLLTAVFCAALWRLGRWGWGRVSETAVGRRLLLLLAGLALVVANAWLLLRA
jgi:hypothetical protein